MATKSINIQIVSAGTPSYISALSSYEVKQLSSVSNSKTKPNQVIDSRWATQFSTMNVNQTYLAWGSGTIRPNGILDTHGGGHNDGAVNALIGFDPRGTTQPTGWFVNANTESDPTIVPNPGTGDPYSDGKWCSVHPYRNVAYDATSECFYRLGGSAWHVAGSPTTKIWKYNTSTNVLTDVGNTSITEAPLSMCALFDQASRKILYIASGGRSNVFSTASDSHVSTEFQSTDPALNFTGAWDPSRSRGVLHSADGTMWLVLFNTSTNVRSWSTITVGGTAPPAAAGAAFIYDSVADCYWLYTPYNDSGHIYSLNANGPTWTWTQHTLSGQVPTSLETPSTDYDHGLYGRLGLLPWRAILFAPRMDDYAYVIKLP